MATIDEKVVALNFESGKFESGAGRALSVLEKLKSSLNLKGAGKGLDELQKNASRFSLTGIAEGVDNISNKFSVLGVVAFTIIQNLTNAALNFGRRVSGAIFGPLVEGGRQRALNIEQAKFQFRGLGQDVEKSMASALAAVTGTAYGLDVAAKAAAQFGAAGIDAGAQMTGALRGVAGIAALTNSSFDDIAQIFTTMAGAGRISSQQLYQFATRGINIAASLAKQMGVTEQEVRQMVSEGKISFEDFARSMDDAFGKHAQSANKTFTGALANMRAALARIGADLWTPFLESQRLAFNALSPIIDKTKEAFQPLIDAFGEASLEGAKTFVKLLSSIDFTALSESIPNVLSGITNIFSALGSVLRAVGGAFRDIFPPKTGKDLLSITERFANFTKTLKPSAETIDKLRRTFRGIFAVLDIGKEIVSGVFSVIGRLLGAIIGGSGGFLSLTAAIGDFLVKVRDTLKESGAITGFFSILGSIAAGVVGVISDLAGAIASLFSKNSPGGLSGPLGGLTTALEPLGGVVGGLTTNWDKFVSSVSKSGSIFDSIGKGITAFFSGLGILISNSLQNLNLDSVLAVLNTGIFAALVLAFKKFFGKGSLLEQIGSGGGGFLGSITGIFGGITDSLKAMQQSLQAKAIRDIAIAIGILAVSLLILSTIPEEKMSTTMASLVATFGILIGAIALLSKVMAGPGFLKLPVIIAGLIGLAVAIGILSLALKLMSTMSWDELAKGLTGVAGVLVALSVSASALAKNSLGLIAAGVGITAIAIAMNILALAIKQFGGMSWEELGKGMAAVAGSLVAIGAASRLFPSSMVLIGVGLIAVSIGLKIMASAISQLSGLSWEEIGKGLVAVAGSLFVIAAAMKLMPMTMALQAAGLILVATALHILAGALAKMGGMSVEEIAKGLITLGGALGILAAGLYLMSGTLAGAAALAVAAAGLALLVPALKSLGRQSWGEIVKGLVALALAIGILAAGSLLLAGAVPAMLGLGVALVLIGGGLALAGAGLFLFGLGLAAIAASGAAAAHILINAFGDFVSILPQYAEDIAKAVIVMATSLAEAAPEFIKSMGLILVALSEAIILAAPALVDAAEVVIRELLISLESLAPDLVATGMALLIALLEGLRANIPRIVTLVADIIASFITSLSQNMSKINAAGTTLIVSFLLGISNNLNRIIAAGVTIITRFITGIGNGATRIVRAATQTIVRFLTAIGNAGPRIITAGVNVVIKFIQGISDNATKLVTAGVNVVIKFIEGLGKNGVRLANAAGKTILQFLEGLEAAVDTYAADITEATINIGVAVINGIMVGIARKLQDLWSLLTSVGNRIAEVIRNPLVILSPSKVTEEIGKNVILGLAIGINKTAPKAYKSAEAMSNGVIDAVKSVFQIDSPSKVMKQLGKFIGDGFLEGLKGTQQSIRNAVLTLNAMLSEAISGAKAENAQLKEELKKLRAAEKPDTKAIALAQKTIAKNTRLIKDAGIASKTLIKNLSEDRTELSKLAKQYSQLGVDLDVARGKLKDLTGAREDAARGYFDQYSDLPSMLRDEDALFPNDILGNFKRNLENQSVGVEKFAETLAQLRTLGISDALYKELVDTGVGAQEFATQLLKGGSAAVAEVNAMQARISTAAQALGTSAAASLHDAGVDIAQGVVDGLVSQMKEIEKAMGIIATRIVRTIKRKLKIKSPSKVMEQIGKQTAQGFAGGLKKSQVVVSDAAESVGSAAIDTMRETMAKLSDILATDLDSTPVISPVIDLSEVQRQSEIMQSIFDGITPLSSYGQAAAIANEQQATADALVAAGASTPQMVFEQNNYSPKALTPIEVYRQTRNQLSAARLAVG